MDGNLVKIPIIDLYFSEHGMEVVRGRINVGLFLLAVPRDETMYNKVQFYVGTQFPRAKAAREGIVVKI